MNGKTDRVIRDRYEKLALDKVMRNRKERQYVGKDDSMTDMTNITEKSDIFSGHYEIQIILFLITIIVVAMHTTYHFGIILESNSYLQYMVTTFIFINLYNTATITHAKCLFSFSLFWLFAGFLVPSCPKHALVLGNGCERFCASRSLLGSYVHQRSI